MADERRLIKTGRERWTDAREPPPRWLTSRKGNPYLRLRGHVATVFPLREFFTAPADADNPIIGYKYIVSRDGDVRGTTSAERFERIEDAKGAAYHYLRSLLWTVMTNANWPLFCDHPNEVPMSCPCPAACGCRKWGACRERDASTERADITATDPPLRKIRLP